MWAVGRISLLSWGRPKAAAAEAPSLALVPDVPGNVPPTPEPARIQEIEASVEPEAPRPLPAAALRMTAESATLVIPVPDEEISAVAAPAQPEAAAPTALADPEAPATSSHADSHAESEPHPELAEAPQAEVAEVPQATVEIADATDGAHPVPEPVPVSEAAPPALAEAPSPEPADVGFGSSDIPAAAIVDTDDARDAESSLATEAVEPVAHSSATDDLADAAAPVAVVAEASIEAIPEPEAHASPADALPEPIVRLALQTEDAIDVESAPAPAAVAVKPSMPTPAETGRPPAAPVPEAPARTLVPSAIPTQREPVESSEAAGVGAPSAPRPGWFRRFLRAILSFLRALMGRTSS